MLGARFAPALASFATAATAAQELAAGPPAGFTLTESKGDTLMSLSKQHGGERVTIDVMVCLQQRGGMPWKPVCCCLYRRCAAPCADPMHPTSLHCMSLSRSTAQVNDQPKEELVEDESGAIEADVGAVGGLLGR